MIVLVVLYIVNIIQHVSLPMGWGGGGGVFQAHLTENSCKVFYSFLSFFITVKPVLRGHSKEDQKLVIKTDYCLMQVKYSKEGAYCNTSNLH